MAERRGTKRLFLGIGRDKNFCGERGNKTSICKDLENQNILLQGEGEQNKYLQILGE